MRNSFGPLALGIQQVLVGLVFPAQRWQLIAQAQYYGAGPAYTTELAQLPEQTYQSLREVAVELARLHHRRLAGEHATLQSRRAPAAVPGRPVPRTPRVPPVPTQAGPMPSLPTAADPGLPVPTT